MYLKYIVLFWDNAKLQIKFYNGSAFKNCARFENQTYFGKYTIKMNNPNDEISMYPGLKLGGLYYIQLVMGISKYYKYIILAQHCMRQSINIFHFQNLLGHPLCMALGRYKWNSYGRYIYYFTLLLFLLFVIFLSDFLVSSVAPYSAKQILDACKKYGFRNDTDV